MRSGTGTDETQHEMTDQEKHDERLKMPYRYADMEPATPRPATATGDRIAFKASMTIYTEYLPHEIRMSIGFERPVADMEAIIKAAIIEALATH